MKILIIEDAEVRQIRLKHILEPISDDIDCTKYAKDGIELLEKNAYDVIFLDHDLIGALSGSHLTMEWADRKKDFATQQPLVIIHSMNSEGSKKMEHHLQGMARKIERIPFKLIMLKKVDLLEIIKE